MRQGHFPLCSGVVANRQPSTGSCAEYILCEYLSLIPNNQVTGLAWYPGLNRGLNFCDFFVTWLVQLPDYWGDLLVHDFTALGEIWHRVRKKYPSPAKHIALDWGLSQILELNSLSRNPALTDMLFWEVDYSLDCTFLNITCSRYNQIMYTERLFKNPIEV